MFLNELILKNYQIMIQNIIKYRLKILYINNLKISMSLGPVLAAKRTLPRPDKKEANRSIRPQQTDQVPRGSGQEREGLGAEQGVREGDTRQGVEAARAAGG